MVQNPSSWQFKIPNLRWTIAIGICSLVLVGGGVLYFTRFQRSQLPSESPRTIVTSTINALGRIEPDGEVIRVSAPAISGTGSRIKELWVSEGDFVQAGQVIAVLDSRDRLQATLREAETQVAIAQARLAQVRSGARQGEIAARQAAVSRAEAERIGAVQTQQAAIARLKAALDNAEVEYRRHKTLYQQGAISASSLDSRRLSQQTAQQQLNEAKATLEQTQQTLSASTEEARATVDQVAEIRPTDVVAAQAEVEGAIATFQRVKTELDLAYIRASKAGRILRVQTRVGETVGSNGIVELGQTNQMMVTAEVYESDIGKINVGQSATITSPGNTFEGRLKGVVDRIGFQVAKRDVLDTDPTAATDARVIEVKIRLDATASQRVRGLTNAQVNVEIKP
ncbi:MAG: ABC exporter membrane fusion protein [Leptolyngbya sp. Prado105]|jgi:HlyD family secretion protein|nr:ABC exporter membrane fusion protein [Leptolyngbya sp. Prado105]